MAWLKVTDKARDYPKIVRVASLPGVPESAVREMNGWIMACAAYSAAHFEDYRVPMHIARQEGGMSFDWLLSAAVKTGLVKKKRFEGFEYLELLQDDDYINIVLKDERDRRRKHDRDAKNHTIRVPMLLRDGDQCRYCGTRVVWTGPRQNLRLGTMDHLDPQKETATSADDVVVACLLCNSGRRDAREEWEKSHPLLPPPHREDRMYGAATAKYLTDNGHPTESNLADPKRGKRGGSAGAATQQGGRPAAEPAAPSSTRAPESAGGGRVSADVSQTVSTHVSHSEGRTSALSGTGRDGTGSGPGQEGSGSGRGQEGSGSGRGQEGSGSGRGQDGSGTGRGGAPTSAPIGGETKRRRGSRGSGKGK